MAIVQLPEAVVVGSVILALLFLLLQMVVRRDRLGAKIGMPEWSLSGSWLTTLTAFAALLGTILSAGLLPEGDGFSASTVAGLNLLFGLLIILAPLVYNAFRRLDPGHPAALPAFHGWGWSYLLAMGVTVWAAYGEIGTILLLVLPSIPLPAMIVWVFRFCLIVAGLLIVPYIWNTAGWTLDFQADRGDEHTAAEKPPVPWPLL